MKEGVDVTRLVIFDYDSNSETEDNFVDPDRSDVKRLSSEVYLSQIELFALNLFCIVNKNENFGTSGYIIEYLRRPIEPVWNVRQLIWTFS